MDKRARGVENERREGRQSEWLKQHVDRLHSNSGKTIGSEKRATSTDFSLGAVPPGLNDARSRQQRW